MTDRERVVEKILSWKGAKRGDSVHKHIIDNYNAYKPLPQGYKVKYTDAWCATTVSSAFIECGLDKIFPLECSCQRMITLAKKMNIWEENDAYVPKIGDAVLYDWQDSGIGDNVGTPDHVGLVVEVTGNKFVVCEGNKSNAVGLRELTVNAKNIRGFVKPKFDEKVEVKKETKYQYGIDVSENQKVIDWEKVKASGITFACLRSTKKNFKADAYFERNLNECIRLRIDYSCYKYGYATTEAEAMQEADSVIALLKGRSMMVWYDVEDNVQKNLGKLKLEKVIRAFINRCNLHGIKVGIYTYDSFYKAYITDFLKQNYLFWLSRYGKNDGTLNENYKPSGEWFAWQYTSKGRIPGINGDVDLDVM